ncbi:uncharacterized protein LOC143203553 [Rhynchophorus ferrugineus]|uniref:uncharacterized protein LOC143203553 n=1 Tax=Rhynchophorus ferrugineus TaxID=354439 RepID=UPI003FCEB814
MSQAGDDCSKEKNVREHLKLFLEPIEHLSLISDSESDCSSGISDVFAECHQNSFLRPLPGRRTRYLTKLEADWKTVDMFTDDFKKTIKEVRNECNVDNLMLNETEEIIEAVLNSSEGEPFLKGWNKIPIEDPINVESEISATDTTSNSAVWNMIKSHRGLYFYASPPHYDIYCAKPDHFLKRPYVDWEKLNESRKKCEYWLDRQC